MMKRIHLTLPGRAPGDELVLTGAVRDLKLQYGNSVEIQVQGRFPGIWRRNPYTTNLAGKKDVLEFNPNEQDEILSMRRTGERRHYLTAYHRQIGRALGLEIPVRFSAPDLHLSGRERHQSPIPGRYWVVVPGGKQDMTTKMWDNARWQETIDRLRRWGLRFVQEGAKKRDCRHEPMTGVLCLLGMTSIRDLIVNIQHAEGVICGVSLPMHIAGALGKPCVVVAGGREEPWWEAYVDDYRAFGPHASSVQTPHRFLHTIGKLSCCSGQVPRVACWQRRVVPLQSGNPQHNLKLCEMPVLTGPQPLPRCMELIEVDHVVEAVMSYYEDGTLPPPHWTNRWTPSSRAQSTRRPAPTAETRPVS